MDNQQVPSDGNFREKIQGCFQVDLFMIFVCFLLKAFFLVVMGDLVRQYSVVRVCTKL